MSEPSAERREPGGDRGRAAAARAARHPAWCRAGCGSGRTPSSRCDEPMANSSRLVLPTSTAPAARSRSTTVASYGGRQPSRIRDEHVVGMPRVHRLSLSATGTPASGPGSSPAATAASTASAAARASSASTRLKAWISASRASMRGEVLLDARRPARPLARPDGGGDARRRASRRLARGSAARGTGRPRRVGRGGQHLVAVEAGPHDVVAQHVDQRDGCVIGATSSRSSASTSARARAWRRADP